MRSNGPGCFLIVVSVDGLDGTCCYSPPLQKSFPHIRPSCWPTTELVCIVVWY
ncbi:Uncharacterized protein APZ42_002334 [Daphnia magna]|uniref:Uncharacterized protein n=1 Tax=Daphnia magna TaxID=35525 RepID=A0A162C5F8_9CRUS|nr:Uncharacterized protein APZ42_002334 [Daphnia magna]